MSIHCNFTYITHTENLWCQLYRGHNRQRHLDQIKHEYFHTKINQFMVRILFFHYWLHCRVLYAHVNVVIASYVEQKLKC